MMPDEIESLIAARAAAMAQHDGAPVSAVHIVGAVNGLQGELLAARDRLLNPKPPAAEPVAEPAAEEPVAEPEPQAEPEPEALELEQEAAAADTEVQAAAETEAPASDPGKGAKA